MMYDDDYGDAEGNRRDDDEARRRQREAELNALGPTAPDDGGGGGGNDPFADYNGGSPPDAPLATGTGWVWNGTKWTQTPGSGLGYQPKTGGFQVDNAPTVRPSGGGGGSAPQINFQMPAFQPAGGGFQANWTAPTVTPAKTSAITEQMRGILSSRLNDLAQPHDILHDPIYQQQINAYNVGQARDAARQRKILAERSAAGGTLNSGGFNTNLNQVVQKQGENSSRYAAQTASDRLTAREAQLNQAIQMARAVGQDDVALSLENEKLALSQAALQLQGSLGYGDLNLRDMLGRGQLNLGLMNALMGNQQFYDNLGFSYAGLTNQANRDATLAALGG